MEKYTYGVPYQIFLCNPKVLSNVKIDPSNHEHNLYVHAPYTFNPARYSDNNVDKMRSLLNASYKALS